MFSRMIKAIRRRRRRNVDPPLYPGAINIEKRQLQENWRIRETTFQTQDSPQAVFIFYKNKLVKMGWKLEDENLEAGFLYFGYVRSRFLLRPDISHRIFRLLHIPYWSEGGGPAYGLVLEAKVENESKTTLKLMDSISGPFKWSSDW
jgi:hypothetical protein